MGLFISNCKSCNQEIHWFLTAPSHTCKCGTYMTPEEVEKSWDVNYHNHLVDLVKSQMAKTGEDVNTVCYRLRLNPNILQ